MDELVGLPYMVGKSEMSSFYPSKNHNKISLVASDMTKIVHKGIVWYICNFLTQTS